MKLNQEKVTYTRLQAEYIIHTVGSIYQDGKHQEEKILSECYSCVGKMRLGVSVPCANIDVAEASYHLGIAKDRAVNYCNDARGVRTNYEAVGSAVFSMHSEIDQDYRKRKTEK